jgi:hypothetical protein
MEGLYRTNPGPDGLIWAQIKGAGQRAGSPKTRAGRLLTVEASSDIAEDVLDLVTKKNENDDDNDCDQYEDKGVLNHALSLFIILTMKQLTELYVQTGQQDVFHLLSEQDMCPRRLVNAVILKHFRA